jgi:hypothetical protein
MLTVFLDLKRPLFLDFRSCSDTVSANCYWQTLLIVHTKIKDRHPGQLTVGIILQHDIACFFVAQRVQDQLNAMHWEVMTHPAQPGHLILQFSFFGPTHKALTSHMFTAEGDLQRAVLWWLSQQPEEFFADGEH